jgi:hypothetical protein
MAKPFSEWTVLPHGKLEHLEDNLICVTGTMHMPPMGQVTRRMTIVRLSDGRLIIYSAIALAEPEMIALEAFGTPTYLIIPNNIHRMDAKPWKARYPALKVITPAGARDKVQEVVPVDATQADFGDPAIRFVPISGTADLEAALVIEAETGTTLVLNDLIFDLENRPGFMGWLFKAVGLTGDEPHIAPPVRLREVKDKPAVAAQLESWARLPGLKRVIIAHGNIITEDPAAMLERVAKELRA